MAYTQENAHISVDTPLGKDKLLLRHFHGEEGISRLFHFSLEMHSEARDLDFSKVVGQSATVTVTTEDGGARHFNGIIGRFVQAGREEKLATYFAEIHPWLWLLTMNVDCRIFQQKSVPDIIEEVFSDKGFSDYRNQLKGSYSPREYTVQYNESSFEFLSRLMEDEGIFYFFEHKDGLHTLVLADDLSSFKPCPGGEKVKYGSNELWVQQNVVTQCSLEQNVIPGTFALNDFNFETPSTKLTSSVDSSIASNGTPRRIYEYPGGFLQKDAGESRASVRIQEQEVPAKLLRGESNCRAFTAGGKFTLEEHYRADVNGDYVVCRVSHSGSMEHYTNSFEACPADVAFRPPRTTRKPVIPGTQTAIVVGKGGEEIWTDPYGRVKVQFHWDQLGKNDENSSCWIRVAQGWAGKSWGLITIPRIGQEVVVSFLEGDPDRPLITGSVYNAEQTVPYGLPGAATQSTLKSNSSKGGGGNNEIRLEDAKGSEELYIHAQKDQNIKVENNKSETVVVNETLDVGADRTRKVGKNETVTVALTRMHNVGVNEMINVGGAQEISVGGYQALTVGAVQTITVVGNQSVSAANMGNDSRGNISTAAGKDISEKSGKNYSIEAGESYSLKAAKNVTIDAGDQVTIQTGKAKIVMKKSGDVTIEGKDITIKGSGNITMKAKKILEN